MLLHADLTKRVVVDTKTARWVPSPEPGVERIMLDRDGGEVARATSIVRYSPGSKFASHEHGRGEDFLVLEGEFRDEHGIYPRGTYVRNPWGSFHAPFSPQGCTLFVRLCQVPEDDRARVCILGAVESSALRDGATENSVVVHATESEWVAIMRWGAGHRADAHAHPHGEEVFVLEGVMEDEQGVYGAGTWLRQPRGSRHQPRSSEGCVLYVRWGLR